MIPFHDGPTYGEWALLWLALLATPAGVYYAALMKSYLKMTRRRDDDG